MHTICETKGRASRLLTAPTGEKEAGDKPDNTVQEARNYLKQLGTAAQRSKTTDEYWGFRERQAVFTCKFLSNWSQLLLGFWSLTSSGKWALERIRANRAHLECCFLRAKLVFRAPRLA